MNAGQTPMEPLELPGRNSSTYGDGDIPGVGPPGIADTTPSVLGECPGRGVEP